MAERTKKNSGADEKTPSYAHYFSWISNTNEGATEEQTLINLNYFKWLHDRYGMKLDIYVLDAGNLDGASATYENPRTSEKLKKQYPTGYGNISKKAAEFGCRLGMWGGADGFGDTDEEEAERIETMVSLCRDHNFAEFKVDTACDWLREEKRPVFKAMVDKCRTYVPDLLVMNHRQNLGEADICATSSLWNGDETYIDIHIYNRFTASHHRACTLIRGLPDNMMRLTEDHGVCLSSFMDYFDDDLVMQAFSRSLILAPEIYANPWLLRDDEQARLAKIYVWHRKYNDILVNGMQLPESCGVGAVSRGDGKTRLLVLNNVSWEKKSVTLTADNAIGLTEAGKRFVIKTMHPYESYRGTVGYGDPFEIEIEPFRAALVLVQEEETFLSTDYALIGARYETVFGPDAVPESARIYASDGVVTSIGTKMAEAAVSVADHTVKAPILLGKTEPVEVPDNAEQLYEATMFRADADNLELQSLKRAGETKFPAVQAARDAFFGQDVYRVRGTEETLLFDGNPDTYYDAESRMYNTRVDGGCLRVDFGRTVHAGTLEIECFSPDEAAQEVPMQQIPCAGTCSTDLLNWTPVTLQFAETIGEAETPVSKRHVNTIFTLRGKRLKAVYTVAADIRYLRLPEPMHRIYSVRLFDENGVELKPVKPHANNMLSPRTDFRMACAATVTIPADAPDGSYLAMAIEGKHEIENVYCAAECDGKPVGFTDRAPSYPVNVWEYIVRKTATGYTYYLNVTPELRGKSLTLYALYRKPVESSAVVWLCDGYCKEPITELKLN